MSHEPNFAQYCQHAAAGRLVPVYRQLVSDALTPVSAFHKLDTGSAACLFESVVGREKVGRYSFLTSEPFFHIQARGRQITTSDAGGQRQWECDDPFEELRRQAQAYQTATLPELPPLVGGAVGYVGYDAVRYWERLPDAPPDDRELPDLSFAFYDRMVVFDNIHKTLFVVALARPQHPDEDPRATYQRACDTVDRLVERLARPEDALPLADIDTSGPPRIEYHSNCEKADFERSVRRCVEYIRAGDIFQVVLSQRLQVPIYSRPFELYRTLRVVNPSPFMFYLRAPGVTLVGSSPEIMVRASNGRITVRPLAGTRPRGHSEEEDRRLAEELLADPKERAEHVMLVDLGRNDIGRVARYGSVQLSDVMTIERYSHVMHITSNIEGELREGLDAFDALRACLPAGTVSGAPKVRAMEIIDELEPHRRGPYAGAVGYIDFCGNMDTCLALRTIVVVGQTAYVQAGAGIVADSDPEAEYQETLNKARGLLKAIEITERRTASGNSGLAGTQ